MYLCYVDESGTSSVPGNSSHFVLAGIALPIWQWRTADQQVNEIAKKYSLGGVEIHTAWLLRPYLEQRRIPGFQALSYEDRRSAAQRARAAELLRLQRTKNPKAYKQAKKNYRSTDAYVHLTHEERANFIADVAIMIRSWSFATLFCECIDKTHFDANRTGRTIDEQAFEQVISRFERYIRRKHPDPSTKGIVVHDNNETVAKRHTELMRKFHDEGTLWTTVDRIIETPMFVDSKLTSMVQMADLCSFAIRRYAENGERELFDLIFSRADAVANKTVGVRHFSNRSCSCLMCLNH
jgi:hypothetical protein